MDPKKSPLLKERTASAVAVFGYGVTGHAAEVYLKSVGWAAEIYDQKGGAGVRSEFTEADAKRCRTVVFSPGFRKDHAWLELARKQGCLCLADTDFAGLLWEGKVIAVTGTNGKTTTCEFIAEMLRKSGRNAICSGNIGKPLVACLGEENTEESIAVLEVSSFQAETLSHLRVDHMLWTNFSETHLDQHGTLSAYFEAKWNLVTRVRGGTVYAGDGVKEYMGFFGMELPAGVKLEEPRPDAWEFPESSAFTHPGQKRNLALALAVLKEYGVSADEVLEVVKRFAPRKNRLQKVVEVRGVSFWNDSKATNFAATLAALRTFTQPVLWIGGGQDRGGGIVHFAHAVAPYIKRAYIIGETKEKLGELLAIEGRSAHAFEELDSAVRAAFADAEEGDNIVLSPGFSSQDAFVGYAERGAVFERSARQLEQEQIKRSEPLILKECL